MVRLRIENMQMNKFWAGGFILMIMIFCQSCFEGDDRIPPQVPGDETNVKIENSIYENQIFFDFGTGEVKSVIPNEDWVLAFDASPGGWQVNINSANLYAVAPTGQNDFESVTPLTSASLYHFDAADGNPDSCAFSEWLNRESFPWLPTGEIFLIGQYDGIRYSPKWKVRIDEYDEKAYNITFSGMNSRPLTRTVEKDDRYNFVYVNLAGDSLNTVVVEPPKTDWDILFSQYGTILYTDDGVPTPYYVRGALLNPYNVEVAMADSIPFDSIFYDQAMNFDYSGIRNRIGYDWKDVKVDFESNTAVYYVKKDSTWLIRDTEGLYYKLRFLSYYNNLGEVGFPEFEYLEL